VALFTINCTTCNARLSVRDQGVIGEILACPKCQSMVLVEPPPGWNGGEPSKPQAAASDPTHKRTVRSAADATFGAASLLSGKAHSERTPAAEERIADSPAADFGETVDQPIEVQLAADQSARAKLQPSGRAPTTSTVDDAATLPSGKAPPAPPPLPNPPVKSAGPHATTAASGQVAQEPDVDQPGGDPLLPDDQWSSPATQRWRQMALLVGGGVAGLLLAVIVFGYLISRGAADSPDLASRSDAASHADGNSAAGPHDDDQGDGANGGPGDDATGDDSDAASVDSSVGPVPVVPTSVATPDTDHSDTNVTPKPPTPSPAPEAPDNPFALDPAPRPAAPDKPEPETGADRVKDLASELEEFAPFLDDVPFLAREALERPSEKDKDAADEAPPAVEMEPIEEDPRAPRPAPRSVNVDAQLALPIAAIEFTDTPLIEYIRFLSKLSNVPITVEPEALAFAAVSPSTPVTVKLNDTTMGGALEHALGSRLSPFEASAGHVLIPSSRKLTEIPHPVDDLVDDDKGLEQLRDAVSILIEPELWLGVAVAEGPPPSLQGKDRKLIARAAPATQVQILMFCQKLRLARGKPLRFSFPPEMFELATRRQRAAAKLSTPLSLNFGRPTLLVDILARVERETGLRILVDWRALEEQGWNPDAVAVLTADEQPLGEALSSLLLPLDLAWRVVDAGTVQVTTPDVLAARAELEFHPAGDLLARGDSAALLARIRKELGPHHFRDAEGVGELHFDEPGKCVITALPQPQQDELSALLRSWRDEASGPAD
jgi:hypothetical protein